MVKKNKLVTSILILSILFVCVFAVFLLTAHKSETTIKEQTQTSKSILAVDRTELTVQSTALDPNLYQALYNLYEKENGVSPTGLTNFSFLNLTELTIIEANIESLTGIDLFYFDNLETLNLSGNAIKTINTIHFSKMPKLKKLILNNQKEDVLETVDLSPNPGTRDNYYLPSLNYLDVSGNMINEIKLNACLNQDPNTGLRTLLAGNNQISKIDISGITNSNNGDSNNDDSNNDDSNNGDSNNGELVVDLSNNLLTELGNITFPRVQNLTNNLNVYLLGNAINSTPEESEKINLFLGLQATLINEIVDEEENTEEKTPLAFELDSNLTYGKLNQENFAIRVVKFKTNGEEKNILSTSYILESNLQDKYSNILPLLGIGEFNLDFGTYSNDEFNPLSTLTLGDLTLNLPAYEFSVLPESPVLTLNYNNKTHTKNFPKISSPATLCFESPNENAELYYSTDLGRTWIKGTSFKITNGGATAVYIKAVVGDYESNITKTTINGAINLYLSNGAIFVIILAVALAFFVVGLPLAAKFLKKR